MDHLDRLARSTLERIHAGYYEGPSVTNATFRRQRSFVAAIRRVQREGRNAVIAEIKPASPSAGPLLSHTDICKLAEGFRETGAVGLSVLTEPTHFGGSLENLKLASKAGLPTLMKDFLLDPVQLDACIACGGSAVLFILTLFHQGYTRISLDEFIREAHRRKLEVLLEVNSLGEYEQALETQVDMIGINNRDLATLRVDLSTTERILHQAPKDRLLWSLSGVEKIEDLQRLKSAGADAFLVGTALMQAGAPEAKLAELLKK